jgi:hypothetical protein
MVLARESIFRLGYFSGFFCLLFWFLLLYCIVLLEELVYFLFIFFWEQIDSYFIFNFGLGISTWAGSGWYLFVVLYFIGPSSPFSWYLVYLQSRAQVVHVGFMVDRVEQTGVSTNPPIFSRYCYYSADAKSSVTDRH